jgi:GTP-binding protein HflX
VGFIRGLPTALVKAFRATLEEVQEAALILHVTDASAPSREEQDRHVRLVLEELGAADKPCVLVLNKTDRLTEDELAELHRVNTTAAPGGRTAAVSALTGDGIEELLALLDTCLPGDPVQTVRFRFPHSEGAALSMLYEHARILSRDDSGVMVEVEAEAPQSLVMRLERFVAA